MVADSSKYFGSFLIIFAVLLTVGRVLGELFRRWKQPAVMGELIAGLILGPSILGNLFPELFNSIFYASENAQLAFDGIARIAIILFLFIEFECLYTKHFRLISLKIKWCWYGLARKPGF